MKKVVALGVIVGLLWVAVAYAIYHGNPDYTLNTSGKNIPHSVTPEDCLTGQYPKAAQQTCVVYLQALYQRINKN